MDTSNPVVNNRPAGNTALPTRTSPPQRGKKTAVLLVQKLEAVKCVEQASNSVAAKKFGVHGKQFQEWRRRKEEIATATSALGNNK